MRAAALLRSVLSALFRRSMVENDVEEELRAHIQDRTNDLERSGVPRAEAERRARLEFGGYQKFKEECRDAQATHFLEALMQDLRFSLRMLRKSSGFTTVAVLTLALGVGANAAIFSFVNAVLLKPLPYPNPERIVSVWEKNSGGFIHNPISTLNFLDWQRQNRCFEFLSAIARDTVTLTGSGRPEELDVHRVSASYFKVLGVRATLGRTFAESEDQVGNDLEVVLSNRIWRSRFGGDSEVIGRKITLDAKTYTIIGVLPANSEFDRTWGVMWLPLAFTPANMTRNYHWLYAIGRLGPGITLKQARDQMDTIGARIATLYPDSNKAWGVTVDPYIDQIVQPELRRSLWVLLAAVAAVLADRVRQCRQSDPGAGYEPRTRDRDSFSIGREPSPPGLAVAYGKHTPWDPGWRSGPRAGQCLYARNETVVAA
jgi:hypothetical protein